MFRHQGKTRTATHNTRIASVLSFVAGMVNVIAFMYMTRITTNITGHFAFFIDYLYLQEWKSAAVFFFYTIFFLAGAFTSSMLIEYVSLRKSFNIYLLPTLLECFMLIGVVVVANFTGTEYTDGLASALLFAMGVQNSFVTRISNAVVRTTHLTGIFTDLGIEFSKMIFRDEENHVKTVSNIHLRLFIILFFFLGGMAGATLHTHIGFVSLLFAPGILVIGLIFDDLRFRYMQMLRRFRIPRHRDYKQASIEAQEAEIAAFHEFQI